MKSISRHWFLSLLVAFTLTSAIGQVEPGPHDFGKMWTFENPPKDWFLKAYNYDLDQTWFDEGREAALKFYNNCSASFVSPNGLIMTNHHCSRDVVTTLQKEGESFDKNGFYATSMADERRNPELYVEQLIKVADVTERIKTAIGNPATDAERTTKTQEAVAAVIKEYTSKPGWEGLRLQTVPFYSGAKYSIYGYKRYTDIRLVFIPETALGFFGGDPDNFTYPRYNLDFTFWRAYDDAGQPLNTSGNYYKFNTDGIQENVPVFVVGNPGSTERYRTVAQLEFDRDYRYRIDIEFYKNRMKVMEEEYAKNPNEDLMNNIFGLSNSLKAISGTAKGLKDPELFNRKVKMEQTIHTNAKGMTYWDDMAKYYGPLSQYYSEVHFLAPTPMSGSILPLMYTINEYKAEATENPESAELDGMEKKLLEMAPAVKDPAEIAAFAMLLGELKKFAQPNDTYLAEILDGRTPEVAAKEILTSSVFADKKDLEKLLDKKTKAFLKKKDPLIEAAHLLGEQYDAGVNAFRSTSPARKLIEQKVAGEVFKVYGNALPPDATFTLRISDGVVKGYDYNGTEAPFKTTYYGMYERYYSNDGQFPWSLPAKWMNPSMDLLKSPMNFVCTADITGGNSGSAIINVKRELVGLAFDGNIESLPGTFIFDESGNRTVGVHAGGIVAALRYIYKADRLVAELSGN